eukprot:GFYU01004331.1.p1 GENE.GFYU01004331.1~~GFYU01004331.1.p1  ORF type:complete len:732 (-),score=89.98 GFYU01004331.1:55-2250(-)
MRSQHRVRSLHRRLILIVSALLASLACEPEATTIHQWLSPLEGACGITRQLTSASLVAAGTVENMGDLLRPRHWDGDTVDSDDPYAFSHKCAISNLSVADVDPVSRDVVGGLTFRNRHFKGIPDLHVFHLDFSSEVVQQGILPMLDQGQAWFNITDRVDYASKVRMSITPDQSPVITGLLKSEMDSEARLVVTTFNSSFVSMLSPDKTDDPHTEVLATVDVKSSVHYSADSRVATAIDDENGHMTVVYSERKLQRLIVLRCLDTACTRTLPPVIIDDLADPTVWKTAQHEWVGVNILPHTRMPVIAAKIGRRLNVIHCQTIDCRERDFRALDIKVANVTAPGAFKSIVAPRSSTLYIAYAYDTVITFVECRLHSDCTTKNLYRDPLIFSSKHRTYLELTSLEGVDTNIATHRNSTRGGTNEWDLDYSKPGPVALTANRVIQTPDEMVHQKLLHFHCSGGDTCHTLSTKLLLNDVGFANSSYYFEKNFDSDDRKGDYNPPALATEIDYAIDSRGEVNHDLIILFQPVFSSHCQVQTVRCDEPSCFGNKTVTEVYLLYRGDYSGYDDPAYVNTPNPFLSVVLIVGGVISAGLIVALQILRKRGKGDVQKTQAAANDTSARRKNSRKAKGRQHSKSHAWAAGASLSRADAVSEYQRRLLSVEYDPENADLENSDDEDERQRKRTLPAYWDPSYAPPPMSEWAAGVEDTPVVGSVESLGPSWSEDGDNAKTASNV